MKIEPLYDRVLLKSIKPETKSQLILPSSENKSYFSQVVAVGNGDFKVNVGDKVLINKFAGSEFELDNESYILIKECDILAIVKGE